MAVTSIWPIKGRLDVILKYACNPEKTVEKNYTAQSELHAIDSVIEYAADEMKTEKRMYVTGIGCNEYNAVERFKTTLNTCGDKGKRVCYHGYQSFKSDEVDAKTAHKIGKTLAENLWGDKFQVLVTEKTIISVCARNRTGSAKSTVFLLSRNRKPKAKAMPNGKLNLKADRLCAAQSAKP